MLGNMLGIKEKISSRYKAFSALFLASVFSLVFIMSTGPQEPPQFEKEVSPIGTELEDSDNYRFAEHEGKMVFGPYLIEDRRYYYSEGKVLNNNLSSVNRPEVIGLHNFYLKTYLDPIFYSPGENFNLSGFDRFEEDKVLVGPCGLEYDVVPQDYFDDLEVNKEETEAFFRHASMQNAEDLVKQNRETIDGYAGMVGGFVDLINKDVEKNDCFVDVRGEGDGIALSTYTPVNYGITDEVLVNYSRMANENARVALSQVESRERILQGEKSYSIEKTNRSVNSEVVGNHSLKYNSTEALEEFNSRRLDEYTDLFNQSSVSENVSEEKLELNDFADEKKVREKARLADKAPKKFDIRSYCLGGDFTPVYGWDKDVYPNIISGESLVQDSEESSNLKDFFTVCRCPYVEITRLKWHVMSDQYQGVSENRLSRNYTGLNKKAVSEAEASFLRDPGELTFSNLSESYESSLRENLRRGHFDSSMPLMWRRNIQQESRIHRFEEAYDDFWNEKHMSVWDQYYDINGDESFGRDIYSYFFVTESSYSMNFMTYSESVWRLEEKPDKFSGKINSSEVNEQFAFS